MEVVRQILQSHGLADCGEMAVGDSVTLTAPGHMVLTIEKIALRRVSVGHYYTQHGDLMSDPEVVFRIDGDDWIPVRFTQHPNIHQYDEDGLSNIGHFLETWEQNIQRQGYLEKEAHAMDHLSGD